MAEQLYRKRISPASASNVDDMVSKNVLAQLRRDPPPRPPAASLHEHGKPSSGSAVGGHGGGVGVGGKGGGVEASDLISSMAKRLGTLEREMKERQTLLQQVQADNALLKSKLKVAEEEIAKRALSAIEPRGDSAAVMHLRSENARLRAQLKYAWKQVAEMKAFLNDYGMIWMGEPEAEAELTAQGYGPSGALAISRPSGSAAGSPSLLQTLSPEPSDAMAPRRSSHSGAAPGPSSAAAAAAAGAPAAAVPPLRPKGSADDRARASEHGPPGLSPAAAAALERAGEGSGPGPGRPDALPGIEAKRSGSFTAAQPPAGGGSGPASSATSPRPAAAAPVPPVAATAAAAPALAAVPSAQGGLPFTLADLQAKVDELNDLAGDGCGQIVRDRAGQHVLATQDPVNLVIYRDGLQIHTLPAKPFGDPASSAVLRDILDGYFPYVLKRDFPDGVPLRVVDKTSERISSCTPLRRGPGGAGAAAGGTRPGNIRTFGDIDSSNAPAAGEPVSRDKFLSRLPQAVIKNGKVIEIRSDISKMLGGPGGGAAGGDGAKGDVALISTPVDALLSTVQRNHVGPSLPPPSREGQSPATEVTTLQVKSVDGKQTYILKLKYDDAIGSLRSCIDAHHAKAGQAGAKYEIRSAFPARSYTDEAETLRQAGLVPNATLFLRAL